MLSSDIQQCTYHLQLLSTQKMLSTHSTKCCLPAITPVPCSRNAATLPTLVACTCLRGLEMFCSLTAAYLKALISEHRLLLILFRRFSLTHSSSGRSLLITASRHYFSSLCPHHFCCSTYNHVPMRAYVYLLLSTSFEPLKDMNHVRVVYLCPPKKNNPCSQKALSDICRFMH